MATLSRGQTFGSTETISNTKLHNLVDLGGVSNIVDADISVSANIADTKIADITTGNKVRGSALGNLASIPSGAGTIPIANIPSLTSTIINAAYPVGSIYISIVSTNPGTLLGVGTWVAFGTGRTLVGIDSGQTEFDTVEETGGSKTHTLTIAELPSHTHTIGAGDRVASGFTGAGSNSVYGTITTSSVGSNNAHNNLQPYIVVYMWKRTA